MVLGQQKERQLVCLKQRTLTIAFKVLRLRELKFCFASVVSCCMPVKWLQILFKYFLRLLAPSLQFLFKVAQCVSSSPCSQFCSINSFAAIASRFVWGEPSYWVSDLDISEGPCGVRSYSPLLELSRSAT